MADLRLLQNLCEAHGISGREQEVRDLILSEITPYTDEARVDALGNIIAFKSGKERAQKKLMLTAHMDEVGLIVTRVTDEGLLKFSPVGGLDKRILLGKSVTVGKTHIPGVIGAKPVHLLKPDEKDKAVSVSDMYIDIGAKDGEDAEQYVTPGDCACFESDFVVTGSVAMGRALDDRAGCAILIEMLRGELPYDLHFVFSVQEEIGLRGGKTGAYAVDPYAAIVVETTTASDIPGVEDDKQVCQVGGGATVSFMDGSTIYDEAYYKLAMQAGKSVGAKCQLKKAVAGGNDAGAIHVSRAGVRTTAISIPCRYLHAPVGLISVQDYDAAAATVQETARLIAGGFAD